MVFPIGDDNSSRRSLPVVTWTLILANVLVFFVELNQGAALNAFMREWAFVPREFAGDPAGEFHTVFSAMFMHGGWVHLIGNMLYLWIFGDNVEDDLSSMPFLMFYLLCGILATFSQYALMPGSNIPNVGASGAIAGVLGAYLVLHPRRRVTVLIGRGVTQMPAILVIGLWFVLQFISGVASIANTTQTADVGGVAYMAHIGGFVAGVVLVFLFHGRST